jgi:hypothetical protein
MLAAAPGLVDAVGPHPYLGGRPQALHSAAWNGDMEMARLLVEGGADIAALDEEHRGTPRHWAEVSVTVTNNPKCRAVAAYLAGLEAPSS